MDNNKIWVYVFIGMNCYGVVLELMELNNDWFMYIWMGKDNVGNDI